jgi:hypothetical protein
MFLLAGGRVALLNVAIVLCFVFVYPELNNAENISRIVGAFLVESFPELLPRA